MTISKVKSEKEAYIAQSSVKIKVLVVSHAYVTGVNQGKWDSVAAIDGIKVALLIPTGWKAVGWKKLLTLETPYPRLKIYPARILFSGRVGAYFYMPWKIWQVLRDFNPDILHVEQEVFSISAFQMAFCSKLFKKPLVIFGWENLDRQLSPFRHWIRRYVLDTAKAIVSGNYEGKELIDKWGYEGTVEVMPQMGVDSKLFAPRTKADGFTSANLDPSSEGFRVGYMGRLTYQKGLDTLFVAVKKLSQVHDNIKLVMCGSGPDETSLRKDVEELEIADRVEWKGGVPQASVPDEMANFNVLVLPSKTGHTWKEQFGHVLIEAMCMGIPVVGSTCGEIPNVIANPELVFQEGDTAQLTQTLERLLVDKEWYSQAKSFGLSRVHQNYTHERIASRLVDLWQHILH
ncbi:glycosyltransferase [Romeria aff. gracilis LEGE 07310]|uniref:Glycosyltransferase n=1 Tax=Vasconcelosia minhoensis LEGE 07310 TaxID=915328 RepID=A0A8J7AW25_9CYAN|nr:glycosyltransferase [Romeria gracilis]MBE9080139.1 glycosyltransferase [Romeria aff. gracilis LEGE 07310]